MFRIANFFVKIYMKTGISGLGFLDADVKKIYEDNNVLSTHMGWNSISTNKEIKKILKIKEKSFFLFLSLIFFRY